MIYRSLCKDVHRDAAIIPVKSATNAASWSGIQPIPHGLSEACAQV